MTVKTIFILTISLCLLPFSALMAQDTGTPAAQGASVPGLGGIRSTLDGPGYIEFGGGYSDMYPDEHFTPAALLLTRVISRPTSDRVTFDLGYKAVASDPPAGARLRFPDLPDASFVEDPNNHFIGANARSSTARFF